MTKPAVWVQFIIKENNGGENNLLHLKYPTCRKLWSFLFCNYKDLRSQIVLSHPYPQLRLIDRSARLNSVQIIEKHPIFDTKISVSIT